MIFREYQILVLEEYHRKRAAGELSTRLTHPTPAKIKEECELICDRRFDRRDGKMLEEFFGSAGDKAAALRAIKKLPSDELKPLVYFLHGRTKKPGEIIVELLAWLIDFRPRPHEFGRIYSKNEADIPIEEEDETPNGRDEKPMEREQPDRISADMAKGRVAVGGSLTRRRRVGKKKMILVAAFIVACIIGIFWAWLKSTSASTGRCMYWVGDHFQEASCGERHGDTPVVAYDQERLIHFHKITRPDTITENALDSIWYAKYLGAYECYTRPGCHPIDTSMKLQLLTDFVFLRHIHSTQGIENPPK
jgi:hypothetical protein